MRILVTAFDAFDGEEINPTELALTQIPATVGGAEIVKAVLPTEFRAAAAHIRALLQSAQPDAVVCLGQAGGRAAVTPERVAINIADARIPDNAGLQPIDEPICADGPAAYFATLPVKAMVQASLNAGIPAALSNSAGTFVCNYIMYCVLHQLATTEGAATQPVTADGTETAASLAQLTNKQVRAGFVHVPYLPAQTVTKPEQPALALQQIVASLTAMLEAVAQGVADPHLPFGAES